MNKLILLLLLVPFIISSCDENCDCNYIINCNCKDSASDNDKSFWITFGIQNDRNFNGVAVNNESNIYILSNGNLLMSKDSGNTWKLINKENTDIKRFYINKKGYIFTYGQNFRYLYRTTDDGYTWSGQLSPDTALTWEPFLYLFDFGKNDEIFISYSGVGVYYSKNDGNSWKMIRKGNVKEYITNIYSNSKSHIFCFNTTNRIERSTDYGENWTQIKDTLVRNNSSFFYIDNEDNIYSSTKYGIYCSTNNGEDWLKVFDVIYNESIDFIIKYKNHIIFKNFSYGWYHTDDNFKTYNSINYGLDFKTLTVDLNGYIYAAGKGIYRSRLPLK